MADDQKPRVRTLETPMMPDYVRVPTIPPSRVAMAEPEQRNYVHSAPMAGFSQNPPSFAHAPRTGGHPALYMFLGMGVAMLIVAVVLAALFATGHMVFR